jgi:hypothetical protein
MADATTEPKVVEAETKPEVEKKETTETSAAPVRPFQIFCNL